MPLRECEAPPIKGDTKLHCATSSQAILDFKQEIIRGNTQIKAMSTTHVSSSTPLQKGILFWMLRKKLKLLILWNVVQ